MFLFDGAARAGSDTLLKTGVGFGRHSLETHGYVRTGIGQSAGGTTQAEFQAPGAQSKYRFGNEANTNIEIAADYRFSLRQGQDDEAPYVQLFYMVDDFEYYGNYDELGPDRTAQAYVRLANIFAPGLALWIGRRYYDRKFIHMNDHCWLNAGQGAYAGAGIEGINFHVGTLSIAAFRLNDKHIRRSAADDEALRKECSLHAKSLDVRLSEVKITEGGILTIWSQWVTRESSRRLGFKNEDGYGLGFWYDHVLGSGVSDTFAVTYRRGAAMVQGTFNARPVREDQGYDLNESYVWETNNSFLIERSLFSLQWGLVVRHEDFGRKGIGGSAVKWYSSGIRPVYYITDHLHAVMELGLDYVDNGIRDCKGSVRKATFALQLARGCGYYSRPALRFFVTGASWSSDFRGLVGAGPDDAPYGDAIRGLTWGIQTECWW